MTDAAAHVLLVEDDEATRRSVAVNLVAHGYRVAEATDVRSALASWEAARPDVILLDLGLPDADGLVLIRRVRRDATTPILVLSARDGEPDKVAALENGADDYVTKPFGLPELRARIGAVLRRSGGPSAETAGRLLTRGRLLRAVWGVAYGDEAHYLHVYVSRLRRKLDAADPTGRASGLIVAEPGVGYRIAEPDTPT